MNEELERRYRSIIEEYAKLLPEMLDLPKEQQMILPLLPPLHRVKVLYDCPLRESPDRLQFLVAPRGREDGLRELRDFTSGISRLTILDPYFFSGEAGRARDITENFAYTARVAGGTLKTVHVVRDEQLDTKAIIAAISQKLRSSGIRLTHCSSKEFHDRVWIGDARRGVVVGTSFNGLGSRAAFILPLPQPDLNQILEFLYGRKLAHRPRRSAKR